MQIYIYIYIYIHTQNHQADILSLSYCIRLENAMNNRNSTTIFSTFNINNSNIADINTLHQQIMKFIANIVLNNSGTLKPQKQHKISHPAFFICFLYNCYHRLVRHSIAYHHLYTKTSIYCSDPYLYLYHLLP